MPGPGRRGRDDPADHRLAARPRAAGRHHCRDGAGNPRRRDQRRPRPEHLTGAGVLPAAESGFTCYGTVLTSDSTLRFRSHDELADSFALGQIM